MTNELRTALLNASVSLFSVLSLTLIAQGLFNIVALTPVHQILVLASCFLVFVLILISAPVAVFASVWTVARLAAVFDIERAHRLVAGLHPQSLLP